MPHIFSKFENMMPTENDQELLSKKLYSPWRLTILYGLFGILWILLSDNILSFMVQDIHLYQKLQLFKGWFYIGITSLLFYYFASLNNNKVLHLNRKIQNKNEELWTATEELLAMHDSLEQTIVERTTELTDAHNELLVASQQSSVNLIVRNLLHRVNTPLGNSITYTDMIFSDHSADPQDVISDTDKSAIISNIRSSQKQIVLIMDTLKNMLEVDHYEEPSPVDLSEMIPLILYDTFTLPIDLSQAILIIDYPDKIFQLPEKNLRIALISLSQFAKHQRHQHQDTEHANLRITYDDAQLILHYEDPTLVDLDSLGELKDPYTLNAFKTTSAGMELSVLYNSVTFGLNGSLDISCPNNIPTLQITIPLNRDLRERVQNEF